jgi:septum formation topological specificity factor MinE
MLTRSIHKMFIKHDPFRQLEITRQKLLASISTFRVAKSNLNSLMHDMEIEAKNSKENAEKGQAELLRIRNTAANLRAKMQELVDKLGSKAKEEDEYVQLNAELYKVLAKYTQVENRMKQSENFTIKFGSRGAMLKKINQRLIMVEASMDTKLSGFDSMVEDLKKEYETGRKLNAASTAARSVLGVTSDWERDYALEVISDTIVNDFAISASNFKDIEMLTSGYDLNSDELFDNLNAVASKIELGEAPLTDNKKYLNPDYILTNDDKTKVGKGFNSMF